MSELRRGRHRKLSAIQGRMPDARGRSSTDIPDIPEIREVSVFPDTGTLASSPRRQRPPHTNSTSIAGGFLNRYLGGSYRFSSIYAGFNHVATVRAQKSYL